MFRLLLILLMMAMASNIQAQTASVSLSETSAQFKYGMLIGGQSYGRSEMSMGFLYNENDDYVAELGLQVVDEAGNRARGLRIGVGGKVIGAAMPNTDLLALALGLQLNYTLPKLDRITLGGVAYYAPPIVSFMDAESFRELGARVQFALLPQASAFVEYHQFYATLDKGRGSGDIEKGGRIGLLVEF